MKIEIRQTLTFSEWLGGLRDASARARIVVRIRRMGDGNFGDVKALGEGVHEVRIDYGPGYRVYFVPSGDEVVILLCGGDKRRQQADIAKAKQMAKEL